MSDISPEMRDKIIDEVFAGRKIAAIKLYREATGQGLKEAKDFVDELTQKLREESPDKFSTSPKSGCTGVLLIVGLGLAAFAVWRVMS